MTIGPLQLILVKFSDDQHMRQISDEIKAARRSGGSDHRRHVAFCR